MTLLSAFMCSCCCRRGRKLQGKEDGAGKKTWGGGYWREKDRKKGRPETETEADRQTDRQTHTHTHRRTDTGRKKGSGMNSRKTVWDGGKEGKALSGVEDPATLD